MVWQKIFCNRSTNSAVFCAFQWKSFKPLQSLLCNTNSYPYSWLKDLSQSRKRVGILANHEILVPLNVPLVYNLFWCDVGMHSFTWTILKVLILWISLTKIWVLLEFLESYTIQFHIPQKFISNRFSCLKLDDPSTLYSPLFNIYTWHLLYIYIFLYYIVKISFYIPKIY